MIGYCLIFPPETTSLPQGADKYSLPEGTRVGSNSFGDNTYSGPCPPDSNLHHYVFTLYALDTMLNLSSAEEIDTILAAIKRHSIKEAQLTGLYRH